MFGGQSSQVPASSAYALRNQIAASLVLTLVSAVVVLGGVTIAMSRRSATALSELAETADEMRAGGLDVTLETSRSDEIGRLFDAFDEMRQSLREQTLTRRRPASDASPPASAESANREAEAAREAAEELSESLQNRAKDYAEVMAACADGDLTARMSSDTDAESMARIATAYDDLLDEWEDTIREVRSSARPSTPRARRSRRTSTRFRTAAPA